MKELIPSTQVPPLKQELEADEKQGRVRSTLRSLLGESTPCLPGRNTQITSRDFIAYRHMVVEKKKQNQRQTKNTIGSTSQTRLEIGI